jgi:hypothetical protein
MPADKFPEPGEFTRAFKRTHSGAADGADAAEPGAEQPPAAAASEPGEFTQFFKGGLPQPSAKGSAGALPRKPYAVQRPNSAVPLRTLAADNSGAFTEHFGNAPGEAAHREAPPKAEDFGVHNPRLGPAPDLSKQAAAADGGLFALKASVPRPMPSSQSEPGEYTKLFGKDAMPPSPQQSAVGQAPPASIMGDSPRSGSGERSAPTLPVVPSAASAEAPASGAGAARTLQLPVNVMPLNPLPAMGAAAHMNTPIGPANLHAPALPPVKAPASLPGISSLSEQAKLILFFAALAILSVILVVALVVTQKS